MILICLASYTPLKPAEVPDSATLGLQLIDAVKKGHTDMVNALLEAGADPNIADSGGRTPLIWAADSRQKAIVDALLKANAKPNIADEFGRTALYWAAYRGDRDIAKALIDTGANPNIANQFGVTPLIEATIHKYKEIVNVLIAASANPLSRDEANRKAFYYAEDNETRNILRAAEEHWTRAKQPDPIQFLKAYIEKLLAHLWE